MRKLFFVCCIFVLCSCEQYITRGYGGTTTIDLEKGEKLVEATWKGDGEFADLGLENYCGMTKEEIIDYLSDFCEPKTVELLRKE